MLALWALNAYSKADPKMLAKMLPAGGGIGALAACGVSWFFAGIMETAIPLGLFGLGMLGWGPFAATGIFQRTQKTPGQISRVRSAFVEMELDHDSGAMRGRILAGRTRVNRSMRWTWRRCSACCRRSTTKAARYWPLILTAGSPAGVSTRRVVRRRATE